MGIMALKADIKLNAHYIAATLNGINPFISVNICLKVWWMNKNPRLIAKYFLDYVQKYGSKFLFSSLF